MLTLVCLRVTSEEDSSEAVFDLAYTVAESGLRTLLINFTDKEPDKFTTENPSTGLGEAITQRFSSLEGLIVPTSCKCLDYAGLDLEPKLVNQRLRSAGDHSDTFLATRIAEVEYDLVLIATDPHDGLLAKAILFPADLVIPICGKGLVSAAAWVFMAGVPKYKMPEAIMLSGASETFKAVDWIDLPEAGMTSSAALMVFGKLLATRPSL